MKSLNPSINVRHDKIHDLNEDAKRHGDQFTRRIAETLKREKLSWFVMELAWTAGPAMLIGISTATYIGYGKAPTMELFFYFGTYTIIAGIMALIARTIRGATAKKKTDVTQRLLLRTSNQLFRLMTKSRDKIMSELEPAQRKIIAAKIVLRNPAASAISLAVAVRDLTGSKTLVEGIKRIEIFRHHGMQQRIMDEQAFIEEELSTAIEELNDQDPNAAELLIRRFNGDAPTLQEGQERYAGFLERTLNAIEHNDPTLMSSYDVYDVFHFAFEMLNGREIMVLHPDFSGQEEYVTAQEKFEKARALVKQAISKRNSRLKATVEALDEYNNNIVTSVTYSAEELNDMLEESFKALAKDIRRVVKNGEKKEARALLRTTLQALKLYAKVERHQKRSIRFVEAYKRVRKIYDRAWRKYGKTITESLQDEECSKTTLTIREEIITLDEEIHVILCDKLSKLHKHTLDEQRKKISKMSQLDLSITGYKRLAMEYVMILDEILNLGQPDILQGIEYSHAPSFGFVDTNDPARAKIGYALMSIEELQHTRRKVAHRLARNLREYYRVPLSTPIINYLVETFGADPAVLADLNKQNLAAKNNPDEKYNTDIVMKDWEKYFTPLKKKLREKINA